ncbi:MAG: hypothetical protein KJ063_02590 [Anaerolineae bacterium]|nr:hypothetical protein [Anaerolineae bacterium]
MDADDIRELPQWLEGVIANHPRMVAIEEVTDLPFIIPGCFWNSDDDSFEGTPAEVYFAEGILTLRGTPPGFDTPVEVSFLLNELVELTVFALCALCAESDEEE